MFFAAHRFDDHRRVKAVVRCARPEVLWPALGVLWVIAIAVSQGNSAKFLYFDF
jgi:alginate O-acetyltransferase complex protein AlgI